MPRWSPCKRASFIRRLKKLGFDGPYQGARHQFMVLGQHRFTVPNNPEFSVPQLRLLLRELTPMLGREVTLGEWSQLR